MADAEEVLAEVEAVRAVYGEDCLVMRELPPHIAVHIKPRTADVSSQQFVEAVVGIEAGPQYPGEAPVIYILDSKGLDEKRQEQLIASLQARAQELSSCFMLVALYEEAIEILSNMNHPDGDCPLCLDPLFPQDNESGTLPFMKLMSCFHCFHSECIIRWWKWLQEQNKDNSNNVLDSSEALHGQRGIQLRRNSDTYSSQPVGNCPVCRLMFGSKDIEHVLNLLENHSSSLSSGGRDLEDEKEALQSDPEKSRRQKFEALLELQKGKGGLIEPKKILAVLPGMFVPEPATPTTHVDAPAEHSDNAVPTAEILNATSDRPTTSTQRNMNARRGKGRHHCHRQHPRKDQNAQPGKKWIQKDSGGISRQ